MPYSETPDELADWLADKVGVYGGHDDSCIESKPCRVCWVGNISARIRNSVRNEGPTWNRIDLVADRQPADAGNTLIARLQQIPKHHWPSKWCPCGHFRPCPRHDDDHKNP